MRFYFQGDLKANSVKTVLSEVVDSMYQQSTEWTLETECQHLNHSVVYSLHDMECITMTSVFHSHSTRFMESKLLNICKTLKQCVVLAFISMNKDAVQNTLLVEHIPSCAQQILINIRADCFSDILLVVTDNTQDINS